MRRNLFVVGATGKQGSALIRAILNPTSPDPDHQYSVYALTRKVSSPAAEALRRLDSDGNLKIIEGDLDKPVTISKIFEDAKNDGGIWGVFVVLAFPGLGVEAHGEERQGKMMADLALKFGVKVFVYSSMMRNGPKYEDSMVFSGRAKGNIEEYCKLLGEKGLPWILLQPGFFMENFDNYVGALAVAILKQGLKPETTIAIIATEDIGLVAAGVLRDFEKYLNKTIVPVSEYATISQIEDSHLRALGKPIPTVPLAFGWLLMKMNKASQNLIKAMEQQNQTRLDGDFPQWEQQIELAKSAHPMKTYFEWISETKKEIPGKGKPAPSLGSWNQVSLGKLFTGRS